MNSKVEPDELYGELILEHFRDPKHKYENPGATLKTTVLNPLCGDEITLYLKLEGDRISDISFQGKGCSISQAGASMMIEDLIGKTLTEASSALGTFTAVLSGQLPPDAEEAKQLAESVPLYGVRKYAARIRCAMLAWEALHTCLKQREPEKEGNQ